MRREILAIFLSLACPMLVAQTPLNNSSIIKLLKSGISDDVIVSTINASTGYYNTSTEGLIALKKAGASDKVVAAIVEKNAHTAREKPFFYNIRWVNRRPFSHSASSSSCPRSARHTSGGG